MIVTALVQARTGSERLPGKVLAELDGRPVLAHLLDRLRSSHRLDDLVLAVPTGDNELIRWANGEGIDVREGDEHDVLGRFAAVVRERRPDVVVRLTGDCPLIDPDLVDRAVTVFSTRPCDYQILDGYPRGLADIEIVPAARLLQADEQAQDPWEREHVMPFLADPARFEVRRVPAPPGLRRPQYRLCVDEVDDLAAVRAVCARVPEPRSAGQLVAALDADPGLVALNARVAQRS